MIEPIEWRDIPGFEGRYQVNSTGQVKSLQRKEAIWGGKTRLITERILKPQKAKNGYLSIKLRTENSDSFRRFYIHRLVAVAFLGPGPEGYEVNHKDENKENNTVSNLEWVPKSVNLYYGTRNARCSVRGREKSKAIVSFRNGIAVKRYRSMHEAALEGFSRFHIKQCCEGKAAAHKGLTWAYAAEGQEEKP